MQAVVREKSKHPYGVFFIAFTQMWESFSFFGMRALLVLYLVSQAGYSQKEAFILYTLYIAFVKVFALVGGVVVDRFLGYKRAVLIGGTCIMAGHILLTFSSLPSLFFLSLGSIICGSALFRVSLQALLGGLYTKEDPRREGGFTLLYMGMNLGGLLAAVLCGVVAELYGWHAGFGLAALGMVAGLAFFSCTVKAFHEAEKIKRVSSIKVLPVCVACAIGIGLLLSRFEVVQSFALPLGFIGLVLIFCVLGKKMNKTLLFSLGGALALLIAFFTAEELWGSLLMVFSETHIERTVFGFEIPSAAVAAMNPLTIILLGPLFSKKEMKFKSKLAVAFLCLSLAFFILYIASLLAQPSILYLIAGLGVIALGELFLAPSILSFASKSAPPGRAGMMMGMTTLAFSMGSLLSGEVAKMVISPEKIFLLIGACSLGLFIILLGGVLFKKSKYKRRALKENYFT